MWRRSRVRRSPSICLLQRLQVLFPNSSRNQTKQTKSLKVNLHWSTRVTRRWTVSWNPFQTGVRFLPVWLVPAPTTSTLLLVLLSSESSTPRSLHIHFPHAPSLRQTSLLLTEQTQPTSMFDYLQNAAWHLLSGCCGPFQNLERSKQNWTVRRQVFHITVTIHGPIYRFHSGFCSLF